MSKAKLQVYVDEALFRRLRIRAAEVGEPMSALVERALRKELGAMESRDEFARGLGYADYDALLAASETVAVEGDISWYVSRLPDGRWAAWDDAEIAIDRVSIHPTREEAVAYLWGCWDDSLGDETESDRVRWLAGVPRGVPSLEEVYHRVTGAGCDLLDEAGTPLAAGDVYEMGGDAVPVRITWYTEPEPLVEEGDPPTVHPRWQGTNCNWRSAAVAWDERRAKVWGEVIAGRHRFAIVGEADPRP